MKYKIKKREDPPESGEIRETPQIKTTGMSSRCKAARIKGVYY